MSYRFTRAEYARMRKEVMKNLGLTERDVEPAKPPIEIRAMVFDPWSKPKKGPRTTARRPRSLASDKLRRMSRF